MILAGMSVTYGSTCWPPPHTVYHNRGLHAITVTKQGPQAPFNTLCALRLQTPKAHLVPHQGLALSKAMRVKGKGKAIWMMVWSC